MEVYFKNLISKDASLEKLVEDLAEVVNGADNYARAVGANVPEHKREEVMRSLDRLRVGCSKLRTRAIAGARATDKLLRRNPYAIVGVAFALGLIAGLKCCRGSDESDQSD